MQRPYLRQPPEHVTLPAPIWFRVEAMPDNGTYPALRHSWDEFVYCYSGVTELRIGGQILLAPPHMAFWIPAGVDHVGYNRRPTEHVSIYIDRAFSGRMPKEATSLGVTPLLRAMLDRLEGARFDGTPRQARLLRAMVDEMESCAVAQSFLPDSEHPALRRLLGALHETPENRQSTAALARSFGLSERTLLRLCQRDLGMSLTEWRNRLRVVRDSTAAGGAGGREHRT